MEHDKKILKGNSTQSGAEVHHKTMGHVEDVCKAMRLDAKLPTHQALSKKKARAVPLDKKVAARTEEDVEAKEAEQI